MSDEDEDTRSSCVVACGRTRSCRALTAWRPTMGGTSRWQKRDGLAVNSSRAVVVRGVGPCGGADLEELLSKIFPPPPLHQIDR